MPNEHKKIYLLGHPAASGPKASVLPSGQQPNGDCKHMLIETTEKRNCN